MVSSVSLGKSPQRLGTDIASLPGLLIPGAIHIVAERLSPDVQGQIQ